MPEQRIILAIDPRLLREMLSRCFLKAANLNVVQEITNNKALPIAIEDTDAEWVIISLPTDSQLPDWVNHYMNEHPLVRIVAISANGDRVKMKSQDQEEYLVDLSLKDLIHILESSPESV